MCLALAPAELPYGLFIHKPRAYACRQFRLELRPHLLDHSAPPTYAERGKQILCCGMRCIPVEHSAPQLLVYAEHLNVPASEPNPASQHSVIGEAISHVAVGKAFG